MKKKWIIAVLLVLTFAFASVSAYAEEPDGEVPAVVEGQQEAPGEEPEEAPAADEEPEEEADPEQEQGEETSSEETPSAGEPGEEATPSEESTVEEETEAVNPGTEAEGKEPVAEDPAEETEDPAELENPEENTPKENDPVEDEQTSGTDQSEILEELKEILLESIAPALQQSASNTTPYVINFPEQTGSDGEAEEDDNSTIEWVKKQLIPQAASAIMLFIAMWITTRPQANANKALALNNTSIATQMVAFAQSMRMTNDETEKRFAGMSGKYKAMEGKLQSAVEQIAGYKNDIESLLSLDQKLMEAVILGFGNNAELVKKGTAEAICKLFESPNQPNMERVLLEVRKDVEGSNGNEKEEQHID